MVCCWHTRCTVSLEHDINCGLNASLEDTTTAARFINKSNEVICIICMCVYLLAGTTVKVTEPAITSGVLPSALGTGWSLTRIPLVTSGWIFLHSAFTDAAQRTFHQCREPPWLITDSKYTLQENMKMAHHLSIAAGPLRPWCLGNGNVLFWNLMATVWTVMTCYASILNFSWVLIQLCTGAVMLHMLLRWGLKGPILVNRALNWQKYC